jgi:hypothetical protein
MTVDLAALMDQMNRSRFRGGRFERLEGGEWVPWPVLPLDRVGAEEARKVAAQGRPRAKDAA